MTERLKALPLLSPILVVVLVATSVGCSRRSEGTAGTAQPSQPIQSPGTQQETVRPGVDPVGTSRAASIDVGGRDRTYHLYVPSTLPTDAPLPLLVALHGGVGSGTQFEKNSAFDRMAEANGFLVVYPDGIGVGPTDAARTWNGGGCCGPAMKNDVDDVGFISALIDEIGRSFRLDRDRIFATGHSNGAIMSYRLACELSDKIAAIGIYAGALEVPACNPSKPVSVLHIHGTADQNIPIGGGRGPRGISDTDFNPPRQGVETLARSNGCPNDPMVTTSGDITTADWAPCRNGTEVSFVTIEGASHAWPGGVQGVVSEVLVGKAYQGYDATTEIWSFLTSHPRRA